MASALVKWQLKQTSARLRTVREELRLIDEQRIYLNDDADDSELRAIVSDAPGARSEARAAGGQAEAIAKARAHAIEEIRRLEQRQDQLLDRLTAR
jgi:hypothetical protein